MLKRFAAIVAVPILLLAIGYVVWPSKPAVIVPSVPSALDSARSEVEVARKAMGAARDDAAKIQADRLVPKLWAAAADRERDAEAALGKQDFARAQAGYADARQAYVKAAEEAGKQAGILAQTAKAREQRDQIEQARRRAETADAARLAGPLWSRATGIEKNADDALTRGDFDRAAALYRDAEEAFKAAQKQATDQQARFSAEERKQREAQQRALQAAEEVAADTARARRSAEQAEAQRYAARPFAAALDKERSGQTALGNKDYGAAQARFREAQQEYEKATQEAENEKKELLARQRVTEQLRDRMAQARGQAEQADAGRWAVTVFQAAVAKEADGQQALSRGDYAAAQQRFRDAQQEYERARQEALRAAEIDRKRVAEEAEKKRVAGEAERKRLAEERPRQEAERERQRREQQAAIDKPRAEGLARLKQDMEKARGTAASGREQASRIEADKLAKDFFDAARAKESQADTLARREAYADAAAAYRDAAQSYEGAQRRAGAARQERAEADEARARMQAEKQKARAGAAEFKAGRTEEQQADQAYQRLAFKEAAGHYAAAQRQYAGNPAGSPGRGVAVSAPPGASPTPRTETLVRHPTMEAPAEVAVGQEFPLRVSLTEALVTPSVKVEPHTGEAVRVTPQGELRMTLPPPAPGQDTWPIDVVVSAPGFTLRGSPHATIQLPRNGDSTAALFHLRAAPVAGASQPRKLTATLHHNGAYLARITRTVTVTTGAVTAGAVPAPAATSERGRAATFDPDASAADLTVFVLERGDGSGTADVIVTSPHLRPAKGTLTLPRDLPGWLDTQYDRFVAELTTGLSKDRTVPLLRGFGRELYRRFAPATFKEAFWKLRDVRRQDFQSIQIYSDNPLLPWELMRPSRADGSDEGDFLGIDFRIARWHVTESTGQLDRAPQAIALKELVVVAPGYGGSQALPSQQLEVRALQGIRGFRQQAARLASLQALFRSLPDGIIHFAGHGVVKPTRAGAEYLIQLEDSDLDVQMFRGMTASRAGGHPFIFFNACSVGQAQRVTNFVDGWAPAALDAGASGYVGGLWLLSDAGAAEFAVEFYRSFGDSLRRGPIRVSDLLRSVRRLFYDRGDPTFLAYVYYGDPHFRFVPAGGG